MQYQPHDYQTLATTFIEEHPVAALLLGMGLGKTVITLTAIQDLLFDSFEIHKVLVIAPLRVARDTWPAEQAKWSHLRQLRLAVAVGTERQRRQALNSGADITVMNRENVDWLITHSGIKWQWDMVIIDELSSFKNHRAKRHVALMKIRPQVKRIIGLTGTPASNGLMDLWAQFRLLDLGERLGRYISHYRARWFVPDKRSGMQVFTYKPKPSAEDEIYRAISDITLSMRTSDYLTLPPLTVTTTEVTMNGRERKVYNQLAAEMVVELGDEVIDASNAAVLAGKLTQLASGAIYTEAGDPIVVHGRKLDALEDLIEAANGNPVLVAYWWQHDLARIRERFPQARQLKTSADIEAWNDGEIPLGLIHPASAGHGLNLQQGSSILIWYSLTWSLELYQQTNARLYRQGQTKPVTITHIATKDSVDQRILSALESKNMTQSALIDAVAQTLKGETK
ncbi:SNF2-related protein [Varibaculum prostatecancerukia]|uniref:SNF2-related protein n=1 Tax=Varibaculum prostatecancerukia TaxID=2811781 RepID=UPI001C00337F|nr:SNF2-related protein [Varibaculum prostatecancerukia]